MTTGRTLVAGPGRDRGPARGPLRGVRQPPAPGNGLGLSIVDAIAHQLGAELLLEDNEPGLRAVIRFASPAEYDVGAREAP